MDMDFLLVQKMRMGDEQAVESFVLKYYPKILRYCRHRMSFGGCAEDLAQETFLRFFRNLDQYRHYGKAANYLYVIASSVCSDYYRKNREIPVDRLPERADPGMENLEQKVDVRMALDGLPKELREVAVLFFLQERKQKDIARILGISLSLVKYRIQKVRKLFSEYFASGKEEV